MAHEMVIDGDETRDQIYTAVDMGDDGSGDEVYIAVDQAEADLVHAMVDIQSPARRLAPQAASNSEPNPGESSTVQTPLRREDTAADVASAADTPIPAVIDSANQQSSGVIPTHVDALHSAEQVSDQPMPASGAAAANFATSSTESSMATAQSTTPPPEAISALPIPPPAAPGTLPSENENFSAALSRSSARTREKKEPALLGEFVSLADMEGRSHLRFASKSPEVALKAPVQSEADVTSTTTTTETYKAGKAVFTPFTSIITGGVSVPPSPSGSASGSRQQAKRKAQLSPGSDGVGRNAEESEEQQKKRARDIVSPSSSAASFQTASSRIDEAMAKNKKPRKLADRLHDRPQTSLAGSPGEFAAPPQSDARPAEVVRAVSGEVDMDIDGGSESPVKGPSILVGINPPSRAKVGGTTAFNPNQDDFMSLDILDDEDEQSPPPSRLGNRAEQRSGPSGHRVEPRAFPARGLDKGKGRATDSAMCAECGGIMAHSESCSRRLVCTSCNRTGHTSQYCSASWRDYVYHTQAEREAAIQRKATIAAEGGWKYEAVGVLVLDGTVGQCYNCGQSGHWGDDCPEPHWHETYPQPFTAFSRENAQLGPFAKDYLSQGDPAFVQSKKLLHESAANRVSNIRPGSMGKERQKQVMRRQAGNTGGNAVEDDEDDWFDKAKKGNQGQFPGRGNRLGQAPPNHPRGNGPNDRSAGNPGSGNPSRFNIQIRGMAGNNERQSPMQGGGAGQRFYQSDHYNQNRNGNSGFDHGQQRSGRDYAPNDRDSAAHNFYSSGQGGGAVAEWETDYRQSDQHFRPQQNVDQPAPQQRYSRNESGRAPQARGSGQARGGGMQNRGYGGHRQNYYGGY